MNKHKTFSAEYKAKLGILFPYMALLAFMFGALFSEGSWATFLDKTLPLHIALFAGVWLVMGAYVTYQARKQSTFSEVGESYNYDDSADFPTTNPTTGLPMLSDNFASVDASGTGYGQLPD